MRPVSDTGLDQFREVLKDFRRLGPLALKAAVAIPFLDAWTRLGPPPATSLSIATPMAEFLALIWVFHFCYQLKRNQLDRRMKRALVGFCVGAILSFALIEQFTVIPGDGRERVVQGFMLQPEIKPLIADTYTPRDALRDSAYDTSRVWTQTSVTITHVTLIAAWLFTFVSLVIYLGTFVIAQQRTIRSN
jgi:hypothetical protein